MGDDDNIGQEEATRSMPAVTGSPDSGVHRRPTTPYGNDVSRPDNKLHPPPGVDDAGSGGNGKKGKKPKKKRSLGFRIFKITAWVLFFLVVVLPALALLFFSTPPGKSVARGLVEGILQKRYDGEVKLGGLDYSIFGGTLEITGLEINEHSGKKVVGVGKLFIDMDFLSLLSPPIEIDKVLVEGVRLNLESYADGSSNLRRMIKQPMELPAKAITLKDLEVKDVIVHVLRPDGSELSVTDVEVAASLDADPAANKNDVIVKKLALLVGIKREGFALSLPLSTGLELHQASARELRAVLTPQPTTIVVQRADKPELRVPLAFGSIGASIAGGVMDTSISDIAAGPLTIKHIGAHGELPPPGQLGLGPGEHTLDVSGVHVTAKGVNETLGKELLASDVDLGFSVKGPAEKMVVAGNVDTDGGKLALTGWVDVRDMLSPIYEFRLVGSELDTTKLLVNPPRPVKTALDITIKGKGITPGAINAAVHMEIGPTNVDGKVIDMISADATLAGQLVRVENAVLTAFGQDARLDLQLDRGTRDFEARIRLVSKVGQTIEKAREAGVLIMPLPPIEGDLDVDFEARGRLKPQGAAEAEVAGVQKTLAERVPFEELTIKGTMTGKDVKVAQRSVGGLDIKVDVAVKDLQPQGTITAAIDHIDTGTMKIDAVNLEAILEGLVQKIHLTVKDEAQAIDVEARATSTIDLENRRAHVVVEQLDVQRGGFKTKLDAPVTAEITQSKEAGGGLQHVSLQPARLLLAGGVFGVAAELDLSRDPNNPGASKVDAMTVAIDLDKVNIGQLAAAAKKNTKGLSGTVSGSARIAGTPADPAVDFGLLVRGRMKTGAPFTLRGDGQIRDSKLELHATVQDQQRTPLIDLDVFAPLYLPKPGETGKKPGLAPGGRLKVDFELPKTTVGRLAALSPNPLPDTVDPDATIAAEMHLVGSPARPTGDWSLAFEGALLRKRGYADAPSQQRIAVKGSLRPPEHGQSVITLANRLEVFLDAASSQATIDHTLDGTFKRSPLLPNPMSAPWTLEGHLAPIDLAPLHRMGLAKQDLSGMLSHALALSGQGNDVAGTIDLGFDAVQVGANPPASGGTKITIGDKDTRIDTIVKVAGADTLRTNIIVGVAGKGLRALVKDRARLRAAPVSGTIELVDRTLADWHKLIAKVPDLPGKVGGKLTLGGTIATPEAQGAFAWDGFQTVSGKPGRVAFELDANAQTAGGGLVIGPSRDVQIGAKVERKKLPGMDPLPVAFEGKATRVDLLDLLPAFAVAGKPLEVKGLVDMNMVGAFVLGRDPDKQKGLLPESTLSGGLALSGLDIVVPDTDRHIQDGSLRIAAVPGAIMLDGLHLHEVDRQRDDRVLDVSGKLTLVDWKPGAATLKITSKDFLLGGMGFDGPEGELDSDIDISVNGISEPVRVVDVTLNSLDLNAPDRFIRAHYPQRVAYDDVVYLDESQRPAGKLPAPKVAPPPAPVDPNAPAPTPLALDVHLKIPEPIHITQAIPIDVSLQGKMDVSVRGSDVQLDGKIDVVQGWLGAMGRFFDLEDGAITAKGGLDTIKAELHFGYRPSPIALREFALPDGTYDKGRITVFFTLATGQKTYFSGLPGPYLLDMATILNTARTRLWGGPDVVPSETVRFGNGDHALVVTFVQTNLRNLIFMDRFNGWSESLEDPAAYGQISHYDMQRFVSDGGARWRFEARPPEPGQNRMQLGYDWMLANSPRSVLGFGPHFGLDLELGLGLTLDWSSQE